MERRAPGPTWSTQILAIRYVLLPGRGELGGQQGSQLRSRFAVARLAAEELRMFAADEPSDVLCVAREWKFRGRLQPGESSGGSASFSPCSPWQLPAHPADAFVRVAGLCPRPCRGGSCNFGIPETPCALGCVVGYLRQTLGSAACSTSDSQEPLPSSISVFLFCVICS